MRSKTDRGVLVLLDIGLPSLVTARCFDSLPDSFTPQLRLRGRNFRCLKLSVEQTFVARPLPP